MKHREQIQWLPDKQSAKIWIHLKESNSRDPLSIAKPFSLVAHIWFSIQYQNLKGCFWIRAGGTDPPRGWRPSELGGQGKHVKGKDDGKPAQEKRPPAWGCGQNGSLDGGVPVAETCGTRQAVFFFRYAYQKTGELRRICADKTTGQDLHSKTSERVGGFAGVAGSSRTLGPLQCKPR